MRSLIDGGDQVIILDVDQIGTSGWNTYRRKITYLQSGNRGRDSEIMGGLLNSNKSTPKDAKSKAEHSH